MLSTNEPINQWVTRLERFSAHSPQFLWSPSHYFLSDLIGNVLPQSPLKGLSRVRCPPPASASPAGLADRIGFYF
jgi:hypothetical protein